MNASVPAQDPNELFDVVDATDRVVAQAPRAEVHAKKLFHRAVHVIVFDTHGNVILQKRSLAKDTCPGLYSTSCAGHVDAGEDYLPAATRELQEELGISVPVGSLEFVFAQKPSAENGCEFVRVYLIKKFTGTLSPCPAEIDSLRNFSPRELDFAIATNPELFAPSFISVWKTFVSIERSKISARTH